MNTIRIDELRFGDLPRGTTTRFWVNALDMLSGPALIPGIAVRGAQSGPTFFVVAGVHGDEYEGMSAIRRVLATFNPATMHGDFIAMPAVNPFAYEARARIAPWHVDGLNLARVFPGDPNGSPTRMLAHRLLQLVLRNLGEGDLFLDFHSGSADVPFARLIGYRDVPGPATDRAIEVIRHFGIPQLWRIPDSQGPFNAETARRGIVTIGTETTGRAGCEPDDVTVYEHGLRNTLAFMGICPDWPAPERFEHEPKLTTEVLSPATGFFDHAIRMHEVVREGQVLGRIVDHFGDVISEVIAPASGVVWAARSMPPVRVGELLFYIAVE